MLLFVDESDVVVSTSSGYYACLLEMAKTNAKATRFLACFLLVGVGPLNSASRFFFQGSWHACGPRQDFYFEWFIRVSL